MSSKSSPKIYYILSFFPLFFIYFSLVFTPPFHTLFHLFFLFSPLHYQTVLIIPPPPPPHQYGIVYTPALATCQYFGSFNLYRKNVRHLSDFFYLKIVKLNGPGETSTSNSYASYHQLPHRKCDWQTFDTSVI